VHGPHISQRRAGDLHQFGSAIDGHGPASAGSRPTEESMDWMGRLDLKVNPVNLDHLVLRALWDPKGNRDRWDPLDPEDWMVIVAFRVRQVN